MIPVDKAGVPTYDELVFVANEDALERDEDKIRAFIGAVSRGAQAVREDQDKGLDGLLDATPTWTRSSRGSPCGSPCRCSSPPEGKPFGYQDPREWDEFAAWMRENQLISKKTPSAKGAFTNELLPGSGHSPAAQDRRG